VKPYTFHPAASAEYVEAAEYYAAITPPLGGRFFEEIERLIIEVRRQPGRFFQFSPPVRRALARKFPYSIVFLDEPERIWIVAVMHAKRRPGYWLNRMQIP
jgi:toxin ParE1/3/4